MALAARLTSSRLPAAVWNTTFPTFTSGPTSGRLVVVVFRGKRLRRNKLNSVDDYSALPSFSIMSLPVCEKVNSRQALWHPVNLNVVVDTTLGQPVALPSHKIFIPGSVLPTTAEKNTFCSLKLAFVWPVLEYASPVWDSCNKVDSVRLERVQLSIARTIFVCRPQVNMMSNTSVLDQRVGWPMPTWRWCSFKVSLLWKLLHGEGPRHFFPKFHLWWSVELRRR